MKRFGTLRDLEFDLLTFFERLKAITLNGTPLANGICSVLPTVPGRSRKAGREPLGKRGLPETDSTF